MAKIKIISNPYEKAVKFQRWNNDESEWRDIDSSNSKNSGLLNIKITGGFFPFQVLNIVEIIISEFDTEDEQLVIVFEGTADEFNDLSDAVKNSEFCDKCIVISEPAYLENARDILPEVKDLFQKMSPLIAKSVSQDVIRNDLDRYMDASSDVVPICVLGNYSAGKSTFINALIGYEILPSGVEPITAKVYKISRSKYSDRAVVKCKYQGYDVSILFNDTDSVFQGEMPINDLINEIKSALEDIKSEAIWVRVNNTIRVINDFEDRDVENVEISDLIEVEVPFADGVLASTQHPFVIFDTPGSNSASNDRHLKVLKEAMVNMTNGLPIFVATSETLDSTDNEKLYRIIHDLDELDDRFTMIAVNKADEPGLQRRDSNANEEKRILGQAVPRNLYSGGMFYVSSILGLGSKNKGDFLDDFYSEIYEDQIQKFIDSSSKRYKRLYMYDIMPNQIKVRAISEAEAQEDLAYANSGLFSIEKEIESFAGKYAAYNKCVQSQTYLENIFKATDSAIENTKNDLKLERQELEAKFDEEHSKLTYEIKSTAEEKQKEFVKFYAANMLGMLDISSETITVEVLEQKEDDFTLNRENEMGFSEISRDREKTFGTIAGNLKENVISAFKERKMSSLKEIAIDLQTDFNNAIDASQKQYQTRLAVDKSAADDLLMFVADQFEIKLNSKNSAIEAESKAYWTNRTEALREKLVAIVSGSEVLTEGRRSELERIIITYKQISFADSENDTIFNKNNFEKSVHIGSQVLWKSAHLNLEKLVKTYNNHFKEGVQSNYRYIEESHRESAISWTENLLDEIIGNLVKYSPELSRYSQRIAKKKSDLLSWEDTQKQLIKYTQELKDMMDWKIRQ